MDDEFLDHVQIDRGYLKEHPVIREEVFLELEVRF